MGVISGKYDKTRWVPYDAARTIVQAFGGIRSRSQYWRWHKKEKPLHIPRYPNRTYPEWTSWNDYLGVDNSFEKELNRKRMITRPYWEAVRWVQTQKFKDQNDYKKAYEEGDVPLDIPKSPNQFYSEWAGWGVWLGSNIRSYVMSKSENLNMLAMCRIQNQAGNLIEIVTSPDGASALQGAIADRGNLTPYLVFHVAEGEEAAVTKLLETIAQPQGGNQYICPNIHELNFEMDALLQQYVPGK